MSSKEIVKLLRRCMFSDTLLKMAADKIEELESEITRQQAEIERLRKILENRGEICKSCDEKYTEKIKRAKAEAIKEFQHKSESILIKLYEEYHRIANKPNNAWFKRFTKEENEMFYQGRAEAIWECISVNRDIAKEMVGDNSNE